MQKGGVIVRIKSILFLLLAVIFVLSACGETSVSEEAMTKTDNKNAKVIFKDENDESNEAQEQTDSQELSNEKDEKMKKTKAKGIYNGQADPHTIEVETKEGPTAYQLTLEARDDIADLIEGKEVTYVYYDDGIQSTIESISLSDEGIDEMERVTAKGIYNGQADPHTIEVETKDGPTAYQLTLEARDDIEDLIEGQEVTYVYYDNGLQLVIESIELTLEDKEAIKKITEVGMYNGQADPHTIEIETKDGPRAFQLTLEARDDIAALIEGREVTYIYHDNGVQFVIEEIKLNK